MIVLWMRIKMFFTAKSTLDFIKALFISFPIVLVGMYFLILEVGKNNSNKKREESFAEILELTKMPRTTNDFTTYDNTSPNSRDVANDEEAHFWQGSALDYRFTVPKQGNPNK